MLIYVMMPATQRVVAFDFSWLCVNWSVSPLLTPPLNPPLKAPHTRHPRQVLQQSQLSLALGVAEFTVKGSFSAQPAAPARSSL